MICLNADIKILNKLIVICYNIKLHPVSGIKLMNIGYLPLNHLLFLLIDGILLQY